MYQTEIYFFAYLVCWGISLTQISIYALWHTTLTGVNYALLHQTRSLSQNEIQTLEEIDEYLIGLSDSSDSKGEASDEFRTPSFEDLGIVKYSSNNSYGQIFSPKVMTRVISSDLQTPLRTESKSDEYWSIWLDPVIKGEKAVKTQCGHLFHRIWLKASYERGSELCPNWRNSLIKRQEIDKNDLSINEILGSSSNFASSQNINPS